MTKKLLLLSLTLAGGALCLSARNQVLNNYYCMKISPDGKYISGYNDGFCEIKNLQTGESWSYDSDVYSDGNGNCWTEDGMLVGNIGSLPGIWKNGEWTKLKVPDSSVSYTLRGVTPDGKYICGTMGQKKPAGDMEDYLMSGPCVWERQTDGSYGNLVMLPYPEKDITNRIPQYVTANNISDDGLTIVGQVVDGRGMLTFPIVYFKDSEGNWSYDMILPELVNPQNLTFPEYPGEGPMMPMAETFLTPEEYAAYMEALEKWEEQGSDYQSQPWPEEYLGAESLAAYEKAMEEFYAKQSVWEDKFHSWTNVYDKCIRKGCVFVYNDIYLTPDGTKMGLNATEEYNAPGGNGDIMLTPRKNVLPHDGNGREIFTPVVIDIKKDEYKKYTTDFLNGIEMTGIAADGTIVGVNEPQPYPQTFIFPQGDEKYISLQDYIGEKSQATLSWMNQHMIHDVEMYNPENDNYELVEDMMITGIPTITPDLKTIVTTVYAIWTAIGDPYYTYILTPDDPDSVMAIGDENSPLKITLDGTGQLTLSAAADVAVYDITGALRFEKKNIKSASTSLTKGIYIVVATDAAGHTKTLKKLL